LSATRIVIIKNNKGESPPLHLLQINDFSSGGEPTMLRIVASNVCRGEALHAFNRSSRLFPFSRQIYCAARLYVLQA